MSLLYMDQRQKYHTISPETPALSQETAASALSVSNTHGFYTQWFFNDIFRTLRANKISCKKGCPINIRTTFSKKSFLNLIYSRHNSINC